MELWCLEVERQWRAWWGSGSKRRSRKERGKRRAKPDVRQILSGPRIEALLARETLTCGDTGFALLGDPGAERVQAFEAEQITSSLKNDDDGIEKDEFGRPIAFNVCPYKRGQLDTSKKQSFDPENFLFVTADPERASAIRCVPPLQASFSTLDRLNDICDAEAIAWQIQARMALILKREDGPPIADSVSRSDPASNDVDGHLGGDRISELDLGLIFHAGPNETAEGMERTAPNKNFRESFRELVRIAGLPINMALEFMLLDFSEDNYSQTRALVALFVDWILGWQLGIASQFHDPLFDWWLDGRIEGNLIPEPPADFDVSWICPAFPGIDLKAETAAWESQIRLGLRPWSSAVKGQNGDPDVVRKQKERDRVEAIRAAARVKAMTGVETDWQGFCGEPLPPANDPQGSFGPPEVQREDGEPDELELEDLDQDDDEDGNE